jgi:hypothetical protein
LTTRIVTMFESPLALGLTPPGGAFSLSWRCTRVATFGPVISSSAVARWRTGSRKKPLPLSVAFGSSCSSSTLDVALYAVCLPASYADAATSAAATHATMIHQLSRSIRARRRSSAATSGLSTLRGRIRLHCRA